MPCIDVLRRLVAANDNHPGYRHRAAVNTRNFWRLFEAPQMETVK